MQDSTEEKQLLNQEKQTHKVNLKTEYARHMNSKKQSCVPIPPISEEKLSSSSNSSNSSNIEHFLNEENLKNEGKKNYFNYLKQENELRGKISVGFTSQFQSIN